MDTPGIEVRPIITLDGEHEVNEVFLTDVKVPVENRVGEENKGWTYAKYLLTYERTGIAGVGFSKQSLDHLKKVARVQKHNGKPLIEDPMFAARVAQVEIDLMAMDVFNLRIVAAAGAGKAPGPESSILKIVNTELLQELTELCMDGLGHAAQGWLDSPEAALRDFERNVASEFGYFRAATIYGGSNEIQKNIIAKNVLGLPKS